MQEHAPQAVVTGPVALRTPSRSAVEQRVCIEDYFAMLGYVSPQGPGAYCFTAQPLEPGRWLVHFGARTTRTASYAFVVFDVVEGNMVVELGRSPEIPPWAAGNR